MMVQRDFSEKVNRVLLFVLLLFLGLGFRCLQLSLIQHDYYLELSKKPKRKTTVEPASRGLICDRNGTVLAYNTLEYQVGISYDEIRKIPRSKYVLKDKKFQKIPFRSEYIKTLSSFLEKELGIDSYDLEDLIHGKASLFPNQTFTIKEFIDLEVYQKLRAKEKDWPGLKVEMKSKRTYPFNQLASHVIGYMGIIHQKEYDRVKSEIKILTESLEAHERGDPLPLPIGFENFIEIKERYDQLKNKAYQLSSLVGKAEIEGRFDEALRGIFGKKRVEVDIMGRTVRTLPDSVPPKDGDTLCLSIDKDLQKAAEILLAQHEEKRDKNFRVAGKNHHLVQAPWIKGGAIVAMNPKNGQVLALASYPRFNPNDFLKNDQESKNSVIKWLELPNYFEKLWEGEVPLQKEVFDPLLKTFRTISKKFTFELFIDTILSNQSKVKKQLLSLSNLKQAVTILNGIEEIRSILQGCPPLYFIDFLFSDKNHVAIGKKSEDIYTYQFYLDLFLEHQPKIEEIKEKILSGMLSISDNKDKLLFIDILRLFIPFELSLFSNDDLLMKFSISEFFELTQQINQIDKQLKVELKNWFHKKTFRNWRELHFKAYLKERRKIEKEQKIAQKPYLDYLEHEEKKQFKAFYKQERLSFLSSILTGKTSSFNMDYEKEIDRLRKSLLPLEENKPLKSFVFLLEKMDPEKTNSLLTLFRRFDDLTLELYGSYPLKERKKNKTLQALARHFYPPTGFGYSRSYAFQEAAPQGSIFKIITAYEGLRQYLGQNLGSTKELNPLTLIDNSYGKITDEHSQILGYHQDGKKISRFYKGGKLPRSSKRCGKISIKDAIETSSNLYFSILTADLIKSPLDLTRAAKQFGYGFKTGIDLPGEISGIVPYDVLSNKTGLYALSIGQHSLVVSPLQTAKVFSSIVNGGLLLKPQILHSKIKSIETQDTQTNPLQSYSELFNLSTPLFQPTSKKTILETKEIQGKTILKKLFYPAEIQSVLLDGLKRVLNGERGTARPQTILFGTKEQKERYLASQSQMVGKTASAEILYHPFLDQEMHPILCKHIWFASAAYPKDLQKREKDPELVIIVYLRFGDYGKEAAILASELYQEYLKLKNR